MLTRDAIISLAGLDVHPTVRTNVIKNYNMSGALLEEYNSRWSIEKCADVENWSEEDLSAYNDFMGRLRSSKLD